MSVAAVSAACLRDDYPTTASICTMSSCRSPTRQREWTSTLSVRSVRPLPERRIGLESMSIAIRLRRTSWCRRTRCARRRYTTLPADERRVVRRRCSAYPNASSNNCPHRARSSYVRRRCKNKVPNRRSTATAGASVVDLSARSHQRKMSLKLNSQGRPARANVPPGAFAACASDALNRTIADTLIRNSRM